MQIKGTGVLEWGGLGLVLWASSHIAYLPTRMMNDVKNDERLSSLQAVYTYLETRYQEQIEFLKIIETSVKTRLAVLSAVLGIVTFFTVGVWKLPQVNISVPFSLLLLLSLVPLFVFFTLVYHSALNLLDRQGCFPDFSLEAFIKLAEYTQPCLVSVYEDFVKNLSMVIAKNEQIFDGREKEVITFRMLSRWALYSAFLPIAVVIARGILFISP
jgi:hypothetical protein